ncbi:hypothetical protein RN001_014963 [Aquatica leii]|uniref:Luciferin 4-monooxygenase n=1 Tax=Aquatica leii TaxID=1421715 RepID=A0AAN7NYM5_9COLE|nr:hypothetical protein RN001_014963 [Aquatica leii]
MTEFEYKIIDNVIYTPNSDCKPDPKGVGHYYYAQMLKYQNRIAQIDGYTKEEDTFGSLLQRCVRTALTMLDKGLKPGDHISLCAYHHKNSAVPHIASYFTGTIMGAIDPAMSAEEAAHLLKQTLPKVIFANPSTVGLVEEVVARIGTKIEIVVFGETAQHTPFSEFIRLHKNEDTFKPREVEDLNETALIVFSSGSSGMPKGICHSHLSLLYYTNVPRTDVEQILYTVVNPYWSIFPVFLKLSIESGHTRVIYPCFNTNDLWTLFYQHVDFAFLNPLQALQMVRSDKSDKVNLKNVDFLILAGNLMTLEQIDEIKRALPFTNVVHGYGQSEMFSTIFSFNPTAAGLELLKKNPSSVGTVVKGVNYKVVDIETEKVVGPNQIGELRIKTAAQCSGYFNQDSTECFDSDGWLKTGDLFYYNEDLCFYIVDRIKESFKYLHYHISPVEIEKVIMKLNAVDTVVVIGIPHKYDCNHLMAVIKLKTNAIISAEEIVKYVEENIEDKKRLRAGVKFVNDMPMTITGKINRFKLKKMILNNEI